jgi:hypothetical protein
MKNRLKETRTLFRGASYPALRAPVADAPRAH